jgi:8-oxo-dGTP pyrophosphatase MutT (NUDIX family)
MAKRHGPWTIHETARKYEHKLVEVYEDSVTRPDGTPGTYSVVKIKPGAAVLAADDEGFVYLAREFRYAAGRECVEVVGGAIDEGEEPAEAARRELREELGIEAATLTPLGRVDPMTSLIDSPSHLFLATGLTFKEKQNEGSERIKTVRLQLDEAVRMALSGDITHGTSCTLILRARNHMK